MKFISYLIFIKIRFINIFLKKSKQCPICKKKFNKFVPGGIKSKIFDEYEVIGGGYRTNYLCPYCRSNDRERLLYKYFLTKIELLKSYDYFILHIAPENKIRQLLKRNCSNYFSGDKFEEGYSNKYFEDTINLDLQNLDFKDNKFDIVIANHVLEHIPDDYKAVKEVHRILKIGGIAILQVPISLKNRFTLDTKYDDPNERMINYGQQDHLRLYGQDYKSRFIKIGFQIHLIEPISFITKNEIINYGINPKEIIYEFKKI